MSNQREHRGSASPAIAVVGVSALFPGSNDVRGFWRSIVEGQNQIKEVPPQHWLIEDYYDPNPAAPDKTYGKTGAFLGDVPFDALGYGVPPNVVQQTDTSQLLGLIVAQQVLEDAAGGDFQHLDKSRISVILGATGATELVVHLGSRLQRPIWLNALRANGVPEDEAQAICDRIADSYVPWTEASFPGLLGNVVAGRIANKFDLGGTNCVVDAACASSLSALAMGLSELYLRQSDMVIVGGVDTLNDILMYMCFSKTPALSATGDCRPFSDQADGTILGEGLGMLALRRLEDAERDGDPIYAVIRGIGSSSDGAGTAVYAPKSSGQAHALRRAYAAAGYSPRTVELLEAHGTATKAGDAAEFAGAAGVFAEADPDSRQWCAIGSVKSQIGHTKGAAGAASLIKAVLALHHKVLPPTIKVARPNPNLGVDDSPFYINTQVRPWIRDASHPRRAGVSSFGFGGSNFHVTLEEYTGDSRKDEFRPSPTELFLVSGSDVAEITAAARTLTDGFDGVSGFQFLARASQLSFRSADRLRLAVVASDLADLRSKLEAAAAAIERTPTNAQQSPAGWYYSGDAAVNASGNTVGRLAFLFPGQGSQYVGMGGDLAMAFDDSRAVWDEAANLEFEQGGHIHEVVFPRPVFSDDDRASQETRLRATEWAQPAIGVASLSVLALLNRLGVSPDLVGGHSFGEVTALHTAGVLDRKAFFAVARKRGELMAEAAAMFPGAMTAVSHAADAVAALLASWNTGVVIANHNSPEQVVISGIESAIQATEEKLRTAGIRFQRLPVSTAFHSAVVRPAAAPFRTFLEHVAVQRPQLPVYANSTAAAYSTVPDAIRETLAGQIAEPVRFAEQIEAMYAAGVRTFIEVGPGGVLANLVRSCLRDRPHRAITLDRKGQHGLTSLWHGLGQLAVAGVGLALEQLWAGVAVGADPRTRKQPKLAVNISGVNYNKPYPPANGAAGLAAPNPPRNGNHAASNGQPAVADKGAADKAVVGNGRAASNGPVTAVAPPAARTVQPAAPALPPVTQPVSVQQTPAPAAVRPAPAPAPVAPPPAAVQPAPTPISAVPVAAAPIAAPALPVASANAGESLAWVQAFQNLQQQTANAHMAFLQVAEQSLRSLEAMLTGGARGEGRGFDVSSAEQAISAPAPSVTTAPVAYAAVIPAPTPAPTPTAAPVMAPAPEKQLPMVNGQLPIVNEDKTAPAAQPLTINNQQLAIDNSPDLHAIMMAVVTEKTGYPTEMLERGMALDTDLGIDSIKRVEILAAVRERVPSLPEFDTTVMAGLRTLGEIVDYMDGQLGKQQLPMVNGQLPIANESAGSPSFTINHQQLTIDNSSPDLHAIMMAVVTEKTGYPTEMLERGMALDTDLGIDSIKRVEILAAVRERVPSLPEFDTTVMAGLRTLGEIVDYMDGQLGKQQLPMVNGQLPIANESAGSPSFTINHQQLTIDNSSPDLHAIMMAVVTEKTGYPTEMLERGMALDTDLGIDSIKRVEILAAVRERVPSLPEFDTTVMAGLRTLGEIVDYMDGQLGKKQLSMVNGQLPIVNESAVSPSLTINNQQLTIDNSLPDPIRRYILEMVPQPAPGLAPPFLVDGTTVYITDDGRGIAPQLAARLQQAGAQTQVVAAVPADARAVICLDGLRPVRDAEAALAVNAAVFQIATTVAAGYEANGGLFVTVQDTGGDHGLFSASGDRVWLGGLSGLAKTAAQEWPKAVVRTIDLAAEGAAAEAVAERLAAELLYGGADREIGLTADGGRYAFASTEKAASGGAPVVTPDAVIVVSGGGRGVTAATAVALAQSARPRIALLGRTTLEEEPAELRHITDDAGLKKALLAAAQANGKRLTPRELGAAADRILAGREIRATLAALHAAGSEAIYLCCDVTDPAATAVALGEIRARLGPITGLVHGAGVLADKRLAEKTADDFQRVFGAKIGGLRALLAATADDPLKVICLFSSVAARTGNAGQADYAMANEVLNRVAHELAHTRPGCVVKSIGWGPWAGGMVTPVLKAKFDELGVPLIPLENGARRFVAELQQADRSEVETVIGGAPQEGPLINPQQAAVAHVATYDLAISAATDPYLRSHEVNGVVVVPLVLVQEWFLRAANAAGAAPPYNALRKLRVLKGIPLPAFGEQPARLRIHIQPDASDPTVLNATLYDDAGVARFAAQVVQQPPESAEALTKIAAASAAWPHVAVAGASLYGAQLFHGPAFATLQQVDRLGEQGARAEIAVSQSVGWESAPLAPRPSPRGAWRTDPALIDGGLQLARVWGYARLQQLTLPTAVETFVVYEAGLLADGRTVRCIVEGKPIGQAGTRTNLWFVDAASGALIAAVRGLEMYKSSEAALVPAQVGGAQQMRFEPIAIIGQACVLPGALDPAELWDVVMQARDMVTPAPADAWRIDKARVLAAPGSYTQDRAWSDRGGYVQGFEERFDPTGFLLPAAEIKALDPAFQWTLHGVRAALRSARLGAPLGDAAPKTGLIMGNLAYPTAGLVQFAEATWFAAQADGVPRPPGMATPDPRNRFSSGLPAHLTAQALNLTGDAFALDAACASSLYAIKLACDRLQDRRADMMVAGAVNRTDDLFIHIGFCALQAMSRRGESRPFAADADGLVPAEGAAFVVLKRLDDAVAAGDDILGVIRGIGLSNDGNAGGFLSPSAAGQAAALQAAYAAAGLTPGDISLLECHATGTPVGDATEIASAAQLFHGLRDVPIGSLKANLGHLITAAGAAGLIKVLGALRTGMRPPSRPVATPLAALASSPFRLLQAPEPWERVDGAPRRAAISAFGFGGNNAHLIVEEWTAEKQLSIVNGQLPIVNEEQPDLAAQPLTIDHRQLTIDNSPLAIIAIEATVGPYATFADFAQALLDGRGGTTLETVDVDLSGLRFPPNDLKHTLPQQLLILEVARRLAARHPHLSSEHTSVYIGMGCDPEIARYSMRWRLDEWASQWGAAGQPVTPAWVADAKAALIPGLEAAGVIGTMPNIPANRINAQLNLLGPSHTVAAEELSGVRALEIAADALRRGEVDAALVGAVDLSMEPVHQAAAAHLLDPAHQTPGDAAVVLLLKRAEDARRDGDAILATFTIHNSQFTIHNSIENPSLTAAFGHAHAAAGLLNVAVGAHCLHERMRLSAGADGQLHPADPWLAAAPRTVRVQADALGGQAGTVILHAGDAEKGGLTQRRKGAKNGAIHVFSGADAAGVLQALERNEESNAGPARLVIVVQGDATFDSQRDLARAALARVVAAAPLAPRPSPLAKGIYFSPAPMPGEVGFVFTPAAAAYQGMGRELLLALPDLGDQVVGKFPCLARTQDWLATAPRPVTGDPFQILQGCALLSMAHALLTQEWLSIKPDAMLGVSSGETNSMFASGAWHDMDAMFAEIDTSGMYTREIAGDYAAAQRAWAERNPGPIQWAGWRVLAPVAEVEAALQGEEFAYLTMINAPADCLVAGQADACRRVVEKIGLSRCVENANEIIAHHPAVKSWEAEWRAIHHRETQPVPGVRFYSNARGGAYVPDRETVADALTDQATAGVDFRRVVEAAWADGVRIFVEHGPRNVCSGWIRSILGAREHLVVALDRPQNGVDQLLDAVAQLVAAGVAVDYHVLNDALAAPSPESVDAPRRVLSLPAHYPPVVLPPLAALKETNAMSSDYQLMQPPPPLPPVLAYPAPTMPVIAPAAQSRNLTDSGIVLDSSTPAPAPTMPVVARAPQTRNLSDSGFVPTEPARNPMAEQLLHFHATVAAAHQTFLTQQARAMALLAALHNAADVAPEQQRMEKATDTAPSLALEQQRMEKAADTAAAPVLEQQRMEKAAEPALSPASAAPVRAQATTPTTSQFTIDNSQLTIPHSPKPPLPANSAASRPTRQYHDAYPGPALNRQQLEHLASGKISEILGPIFAQQDDFVRQVRMPMPPLLLADRVLGIDAVAGAVGQKGVIWTETDIGPDAWYLHNGRVPVGVLIEAGQADLLLVSYLGADFVNKGERVYRLLGCEVTFRAELPQVGDTLHYEIHLDAYAQHGPVRIFFFHYDCFVGDRLIFSVREGQAGFFTDDELAHSNGVIWDPRTAEIVANPRLDPPAVRCERTAFTQEQVVAFSEGRIVECFGPAFRAAETHVRTPAIARGRMLFFQDVVTFDPTGGPWGRGYLRADDHLTPDKWFFHGHFKNDPCMPGTMMYEGTLQTMAFYMTALGYTLDRDGWRFEPVQDEMYKLVCRGQVIPSNKHVVYELFVEEVIHGPTPTLYADLLVTVDGLAAFHCRRMGLRLVPAFPLESRQTLLEGAELLDPAPERNARTPDHVYDPRSIAACAWGAPSDAFGDLFARFDGPERCPRLPGPPYLFMTRVTAIDAAKAVPVAGGMIEAEYQIPPDAWYFSENGNRTMPYAVLLEAALQPCGWFASYKGSVLQSAEELYFRNLDGTATQHREVFPEDGILRTHVRNTSLSRLGTMTIVGFEVACYVGDDLVFDMTTTFGFFPKAALASQAGLPVTDALRARLAEPSDFRRELRPRPPRYFNSLPALPGPMLLLLDRISGYWPTGGAAGLGRVRAEIDVNPQDWFFKCHFMGDSVQPGSLGIEAMIQALQFLMVEGRGSAPSPAKGEGRDDFHPRFEPIQIGEAMTWKYRGQVLPTATRVTVDMEIVEKGEDYAVADASLWVDGLRIYAASRLGMRIVEDEQGATQRRKDAEAQRERSESSSLRAFVVDSLTTGDELLDPATELWLRDHCPTWTVPALAMMSMVDRLAAGALVRAPGRKVVGLRNVRVHRWLSFAGGAQRVKTLGRPVGSDTVAMQLLVWEEAQQRFALVASGDVIMTEHWQLAGRPWTPLAAGQPEPNPYAAGVLFHGPAYQLLTELQLSDSGATYWLDLDASRVPSGALNQGLLDAATHGIPHDALWRWSAEIPADVAAYPVAITSAAFYGPTPFSGRVRCEARFAGFQGDDRRFPMIRVQIITGDEVWAEFELVETLFPKGPLGQAEPAARRAFLHEQRFVPGMALSSHANGATKVSDTTVKASDWLAGTVAALYAPELAGATLDAEQLTQLVAIKEHVARRWAIHPAHLAVLATGEMSLTQRRRDAEKNIEHKGDNVIAATVGSLRLPLNHARVQVRQQGDNWQVTDAGEDASLDLSAVQRFWRERANAGGTLVEDLTLALMQRFVRRVEIVDPAGYAALHGRGVLYLANHQLDLESVLFVSLIAALQGTVTTAIARQELGESWVGPYFDICFQHPQIVDPHMLLLIDRASPEAVFQTLSDAVARTRTAHNSLLVHVEGRHALAARQPVEVVSTALIDLAVSQQTPIVPVRFAGGLPATPVDAPLAFPVDFGQQDFLIGAPLLPEELAPLSSAERRTCVLDALNGFDGRWQQETPNPGDAAFAAEVAAWQQERGVSDVQAALYRTLAAAPAPGHETQWLLDKVHGKRRRGHALADEVKQWLGKVAHQLLGVNL